MSRPSFDLDAFRASLPTPDQDEGGQLFRSACRRFADQLDFTRIAANAPGGVPDAMGATMAPVAPGMAPAGAGVVPGIPGATPMPGGPADDAAIARRRRRRSWRGGSSHAERGQRATSRLTANGSECNLLEHGWPTDDKDLAVWLERCTPANGRRC